MKPLTVSLLALFSLSLAPFSVQGQGEQDDHLDLARLMQEVEVSLVAIDHDLASAGVGPWDLESEGSARLVERLQSSLRESREVVGAIDKILHFQEGHRKENCSQNSL